MSKKPEDLCPASALERLSRVAVFLSAFVALAFEAWLGAREWGPLTGVTALAFGVTFIVARWSTADAWALVLVPAYICPAIFVATLGRHLPAYQVIWLAALFGAIVARADWTEWAFPALWKLPLAYWALAVALVWPIVVARETDFRWSTMAEPHMSNSGLGGPPAAVALMVLNVALTHLLGLLSFDSFFRTFETNDSRRFRRVVIVPLCVSLLLGAGLAVYQGLVDISWLSGHQWPSLQRAAGGLLDGDGFGTLAGFWSGTALTLANSSVAGLLIGSVGTAIVWGGLWATGSRMALLAGVISLAFTVVYGLRVRRVQRILLVLLFLACTFGALTALGKVQWSTNSPLSRTLESLPPLSRTSLLKFAKTELFDRSGPFGSASIVMLEQFPITGVGVGCFYHLFPDYAYVLIGGRPYYVAFDNAQSWYRHQLAELGVVGSLGWLWWAGTFGWLLVTRRVDENNRFEAGVVKGALVAMAVVSLVSMPAQLAPITLTVWVFAFWYLSLTKKVPNGLPPTRWTRGWMPWLIVWLVAIGFVAETYRIGRTTLRPPYRALSADWSYTRGFYDLQKREGSEPFRGTSDNAVFVFRTTAHYLKLTFWVQHPDVAVRPVAVRIWRRDRRIVSVTVHDNMPTTWYVRVPTGNPWMMLETWVSRTWRPSDYGQKDDDRELGLMLADWTFVDEPPLGAGIIN